MNYKNKYLKYKRKYLNLKKTLYGGTTVVDDNDNDNDNDNDESDDKKQKTEENPKTIYKSFSEFMSWLKAAADELFYEEIHNSNPTIEESLDSPGHEVRSYHKPDGVPRRLNL